MTATLPPPPPPAPSPGPRRPGRFTSEVMAGGSTVEKADDELVGGWRGALGVGVVVAMFAALAFASIWWFVFAVGVLVAIFLHELGHYVTARMTGMKATQFFIGFGPRVWSFRRGETEYGLRLLPLGAFVRIIGMNQMDEVDPADEQRTYRVKSYPRRMLVISAGSLMHVFQAILLLFVVYVGDGEVVARPGAEVAAPSDGSADTITGPALAAGIQPGDVIVSIDGDTVRDRDHLGLLVRTHEAGDEVVVTVLRDGSLVDLPATLAARQADDGVPAELVGTAVLGVATFDATETIDHSVGSAAVNAVTDIFPVAWESTKGVVKVLNPVEVFSHLTGSNDNVETRPTTLVGVGSITDDIGQSQGLYGVLFLLAVLNVFVGVFNMFPLLPLDGGHAAIATYERVREIGQPRGSRYYADVARLMPLAMAVVTLLAFLFLSGLYLDITDPL